MATQRTDKEASKIPPPAKAASTRSTPSPAMSASAESTQGAESPSDAVPDDGHRPFREAYALALVEAQLDAQQQADEALGSYADAIRSVVADVSRRAEEIYRDHARMKAEGQRRGEEALRNFAEACQASPADTQKHAEDYRMFTEALQGIQLEAQQRVEEPLRNYVNGQSDAQGRAAAAFREYTSALQASPGDANAAVEAYRRYTVALEDIQQQTNKRFEEAQRSYVAVQLEAPQRVAEAVRNYSGVPQVEGPGSGARAEAAKNFMAAAQALHTDLQHSAEGVARSQLGSQVQAQQRAAESYCTYLTALQEVRTSAQRRQVDAYRDYLLALQVEWSRLNVDAVVGTERG